MQIGWNLEFGKVFNTNLWPPWNKNRKFWLKLAGGLLWLFVWEIRKNCPQDDLLAPRFQVMKIFLTLPFIILSQVARRIFKKKTFIYFYFLKVFSNKIAWGVCSPPGSWMNTGKMLLHYKSVFFSYRGLKAKKSIFIPIREVWWDLVKFISFKKSKNITRYDFAQSMNNFSSSARNKSKLF